MKKVNAFLTQKNLPQDKKELIIRTLSNTILTENINKVINGETQLKRVFSKIVDDLGIYYKIGLTTDFTGKLFNEMYSWLGFTQDKLNDVVLTPSYVATLLVRLARVNKDSYVWDFATGSAGLLVAAMNEMLIDAKNSITSPDELAKKEVKIKAEQLLGLEILSSVYMLAILNMIMMGDGSSNILNQDSLKNFNGEYGFGKKDEKFPATAFVLNPPYSAPGNGMIFVETALSMMSKGYASVIIQNSAGSGKAKEINKKILEHNTLIASIKMPNDLFVGKSSVQTNIYVFKVGERHEKDEIVKFIDFSNDGYTRSNRKKASVNLKDTNNAKERYDELVNLVRFGKSKLKIFSQNEYYESTIDPKNGADWNKQAPVDTKPTLADFKKSVSDYLAWEVSLILKKDSPSSLNSTLINKHNSTKWQEFEIEKLFESFNGNFDIKKEHINGLGEFVITAGLGEHGVLGKTDIKAKIFDKNTITIDMFGNAFYRNFKYKMVTHARVFCLKPLFKMSQKQGLFIASALHFLKYKFGYENMCSWTKIKNEKILLPTKNGEIDFDFMENFISELEKERVRELEAYLLATGLKDYELTQNEKDALAKFDEFSKFGVASEFKIGDLFYVKSNPQLNKDSFKFSDNAEYPYFTRTVLNNGIAGYVDYLDDEHKITGNSLAVGMLGMQFFYMQKDFYAGQFTKTIYPKFENFNSVIAQYFITWLNKNQEIYQSGLVRDFENLFNNTKISLLAKNGKIDFEFMSDFIRAVQKLVIKDVVLWSDKKIEATKTAIAR